jgi:hypothetical protein
MINGLARDGITVFVTTHYLDEAEHATGAAMLYEGALRALGTPHELKHSVFSGQVYELTCAAPLAALGVVQRTPSVREVTLYGATLNILTGTVPAARETIVDHLRSEGVTVHTIEPVAPTLEDVFISLMHQEGQGASGAASSQGQYALHELALNRLSPNRRAINQRLTRRNRPDDQTMPSSWRHLVASGQYTAGRGSEERPAQAQWEMLQLQTTGA